MKKFLFQEFHVDRFNDAINIRQLDLQWQEKFSSRCLSNEEKNSVDIKQLKAQEEKKNERMFKEENETLLLRID